MPGEPVEFTDNTIIIITGYSGIGKSTLASFLSKNRPDIKYLATDSFFNPSFVKKNKFKHPKYKESFKFLNSINNPTAKVSVLSRTIDKSFFTKLIMKVISNEYNNGYKCIILEGYTIKYVYSKLLRNIKRKNIRIWNVYNESE